MGQADQDRITRKRRDALITSMLLLLIAGFVMLVVVSLAAVQSEIERCPTQNGDCPRVFPMGLVAIGGTAAGLLLGCVGGGLAVRRGDSPTRWIVAAWVLMLVVTVSSAKIAAELGT